MNTPWIVLSWIIVLVRTRTVQHNNMYSTLHMYTAYTIALYNTTSTTWRHESKRPVIYLPVLLVHSVRYGTVSNAKRAPHDYYHAAIQETKQRHHHMHVLVRTNLRFGSARYGTVRTVKRGTGWIRYSRYQLVRYSYSQSNSHSINNNGSTNKSIKNKQAQHLLLDYQY